VARVRALLAQELAGCPAVDDVILMADELVSNAVLHSNSGRPGGTFGLRVLARPRESVRVEVTDAGGAWARSGRAGDFSSQDAPGSFSPGGGCLTGGRGLRIVEALAAAWGVSGDENGRTVWFTLAWAA